LGAEFSWAINTSVEIFSAQRALSWEHQYEGNAVAITGNFVGENSSKAFEIETNILGEDYLNAQLGFTATFKHGVSAYLIYETFLERNDLDADIYSFSLQDQF